MHKGVAKKKTHTHTHFHIDDLCLAEMKKGVFAPVAQRNFNH